MKAKVTPWMEAPVRLDGPNEFVVGDVHGFSEHLRAILSAMAAASKGRCILTYLGDLIDRGPDSLGCLKIEALSPASQGFSEVHRLMGNHEIFMKTFMLGGRRAADIAALWHFNGGGEVFRQVDLRLDADLNAAVRDPSILRRTLGCDVSSMLDNLATHRRVGNLTMVHAGLNPRVPMKRWFAGDPLNVVSEDHFAWIRSPFLNHEKRFEDDVLVVHGHTPDDEVLSMKGRVGEPMNRLDGWRVNLDGGSYKTGRVCGAEFRDGGYRVYCANASVE